ncbi:MAG: HAD family hydrolase [Rhodospirillaceae bacterium]|jgi:HAD superfamily hydrolase (TIGR01509 family)|nr:HAD family hydrolase [Rhodospirillales bacterium]MBT6406613.1 HAD family hydrolase [Rhodospirillaceae bacterium]
MAADLVIFDCDGVLVDSEMLASRLMATRLTREGYPITAQQCRDRYTGISLASLKTAVEKDWGKKLPEDFEETVRAHDLGVFARELEAVPGVADALRKIDIPVCVASSGVPEKIENSLQTTGLMEFFEPHLFSTSLVAKGKPAPDIFLYAARQMGVDPARCVVVEDAEAGIRGGLDAGMQVFGFAGGGHCGPGYMQMLHKAGAGLVFENMARLPELLGIQTPSSG